MEYPIVPKLNISFTNQRNTGGGVLKTAGPYCAPSFGYREGKAVI